MIKLSNAVVIANTSDELTALQGLLAPSYPEFIFSIVDTTGPEKDNFPFKMTVDIDTSIPNVVLPSMSEFFDLLVAKIDQLNNPIV